MKYVILGHQNPDVDSILSGVLLEKILNKFTKDEFKFIIPDDSIDDITKEIVKDTGIDISQYQTKEIDKDARIILVDHYEDNRYPNIICAIYDHHPPKTDFINPLKHAYYNTNSCSTTTLLAKIFNEYLTKEDFILVLIGAIVDTVSFKSSKTNQEEVKFLLEKCQEYNININDYLDIGLCLNKLDNLNEVALYGLKEYTIQGKNVKSSYIQIKDVDKNKEKIAMILNILTNYIKQNNIDIFVFIVHDMDNFKTTTYEITENGIAETKYDEYTSRGSKIIPDLDLKLSDKKTTRM